MGTTQSTIKRNESTPTMAYGRLRIHESPRILRNPTSIVTDHDGSNMAMMTRSFSADGLRLLRNTNDFIPPRELTPLIGQQQQQQLEIYKTNSSSFTQLHSSGPKLALWITPALLCGLSYGTYVLLLMHLHLDSGFRLTDSLPMTLLIQIIYQIQ